jgi:hypothetical protein
MIIEQAPSLAAERKLCWRRKERCHTHICTKLQIKYQGRTRHAQCHTHTNTNTHTHIHTHTHMHAGVCRGKAWLQHGSGRTPNIHRDHTRAARLSPRCHRSGPFRIKLRVLCRSWEATPCSASHVKLVLAAAAGKQRHRATALVGAIATASHSAS